jgi:hypothetical protein
VNALIPVFVAVLLAEFGGSLATFGPKRRVVVAIAVALLVVAAAIGGWAIAGILVTPARTMLLGLALLFAGFGKFERRKEIAGEPTLLASAMLVYRSPTPFLVFSFASLMSAPISAAIGALAGVGVVMTVGPLVGGANEVAIPPRVRAGAGIILCLAGIFAALSGLRLV